MKISTKTEKFIKRSKEKYGTRFNYDKVNYIDNETKVSLFCNKHKIPFEVTPHQHLRKNCETGGCPMCGKSPCHSNTTKEILQKIFLEKCKEKFGEDRFDYSQVNYIDNSTEVTIICKKHGEFKVKPATHLDKDTNSGGCGACGRLSSELTPEKKTYFFIKKSKEIFGDRFDYSKTSVINSEIPVTIICKKHGEFKVTTGNHLRESSRNSGGCEKCGIESMIEIKKDRYAKEFEEKARKIHKNLYDYSKVNYIKNNENIAIICKKHGIFYQLPNVHLSGSGCPLCFERSKMETYFADFLDLNNIDYLREFKIKQNNFLKNKPFDFYIKKFNLLIEIQGSQHYETKFGYSEDQLKNRIALDEKKKEEAINENFNYLAINQKNKSISLVDKILNNIKSSTTINELYLNFEKFREIDLNRIDLVILVDD